jgi:hypothetical protein
MPVKLSCADPFQLKKDNIRDTATGIRVKQKYPIKLGAMKE